MDPSGGAGAAADIRLIEAEGAVGMAVITALTVQNTHGVFGLSPTAPAILKSQLDCLLEDVKPDAVKIGLLPSAEAVDVVAAAVTRWSLVNVVLDPVIGSSAGVPFLDKLGQERVLKALLPHCLIVTPNLDEARLL